MVQKPPDHSANTSFNLLTTQQSFHFCIDPVEASLPISCPVWFKEGPLIKLLINQPEQQRQELTHILLGVGLFFETQNSISPSLQSRIRFAEMAAPSAIARISPSKHVHECTANVTLYAGRSLGLSSQRHKDCWLIAGAEALTEKIIKGNESINSSSDCACMCVHVCVSDVGPNLVRNIFSSVFNNTKAFRAPLDCWSTGGAGQ